MGRAKGIRLSPQGLDALEEAIKALDWENKSNAGIGSRITTANESGVRSVRTAAKTVTKETLKTVCEGVKFYDWESYLASPDTETPQSSEKASIQESAKPVYHIPYFPSVKFVGREQELQTIHQAFQSTTKPVAISAVAGMGGIGKTQLAIQYAHQHQADYPGGVCWFNARESDLATELLYHAQERLNLEVPQKIQGKPRALAQQVEWCWQHWKPPEGLVLVVLDDVTDMAIAQKILPTVNANRFRFLITTRIQNLDSSSVREIPLPVLSLGKSLEFLGKLLGERDKRIEREPKAAHDLCHYLGYLPLALELVGQYLAQYQSLSLPKMLERLEASGLDDKALLHQYSKTSPAQLGVQKAFELCWRELDETTQLVGKLLSLFNPELIPWHLVCFVKRSLTLANEDVDKARNQLNRFSFLQNSYDQYDCCIIHPLIKEFLYAKLVKSPQAQALKEACALRMVGDAAMITLAVSNDDSNTRSLLNLIKKMIPHLEQFAKDQINTLDTKSLITLLRGLGNFYKEYGLYKTAEHWFKKRLSVAQKRFGTNDLGYAISCSDLANVYQSQGCYAQAESLYQQALKIQLLLLGDNHPNVAIILNNLANVYHSQGRYAQAESLHLQVLQLHKHRGGNEQRAVATSLNNLASLYHSQGRYAEAESHFLQTLELQKRLLGDEHPDVATSLNNLASLYHSQGRYAEAESHFLQTLELQKRLRGDENPYVATSLNNLASLYHSQGRYAEAERLYSQELKINQEKLGAEHPNTIQSLRMNGMKITVNP